MEGIIGLLARGRRAGTLWIEATAGLARIHVSDGQIRDVAYASCAGESALFHLLTDRKGEFEFRPSESIEASPNMGASMDTLLTEAARSHAERLRSGVVPAAAGGAELREPESRLPALGSVIDKYRIDALLGTGAFATVYRATHLLLRTTVALKLLRPDIAREHPCQAEFLCEEARCTARLNHPSIVRVFDVTHTTRYTYIVMEHVEGVSLAEAIRRSGCLDPRRVLELGAQICLALKAALLHGLTHRDIKPANVLLAGNGTVKIVDLGLAHHVDDRIERLVGTPAYMAPEQTVDSVRVDFRSDVYSLGVTLYHAALGRLPFVSRDPHELIHLHRNAPVPAPEKVRPGFPSELSRVLQWMLQKRPEARPASYEELLAAFQEATERLALCDPRPEAGPGASKT